MALVVLDQRLRNPKDWPWAVSLLTHLLLCTCVEQIQVAVDAFAFSELPRAGSDPAAAQQEGRDVARLLEQWTLEHSWLFLEGILGGPTKKHHPFTAEGPMGRECGLSEAEKNLVTDIRWILNDHGDSFLRH